jgi:hypothetical protein
VEAREDVQSLNLFVILTIKKKGEKKKKEEGLNPLERRRSLCFCGGEGLCEDYN